MTVVGQQTGEMDPSLQTSLNSVGQRCGIDAEALYKKYTAMVGEVPVRDRNGKTDSNTTALDRLCICQRCNGYGLVKERYNHQVKEVNCGECGGDGMKAK